jgi:hypothetical protein
MFPGNAGTIFLANIPSNQGSGTLRGEFPAATGFEIGRMW